MNELKDKKAFICDMDGVIYHGNRLLPGVKEFAEWLFKENKKFLFLTNSPERSPKELQQKLVRMGLEIGEEHFYTSAQAAAEYISKKNPGCGVYAVGGAGLITALHRAGIAMNDEDPAYVIIGEGGGYNYESLCKAVRLVLCGATLLGTNSDATYPVEDSFAPGCRSITAPVEIATGKDAYFIGKPNPLMMNSALKILGVSAGEAVMIGDRMDTDILAGIKTDIDTVLVLSGIADMEEVKKYDFKPKYILNGVGDIVK